MRNAILVHGMPSKEEYFDSSNIISESNAHWFPWLQHELTIAGVLAQTPEMSKPYAPDYRKWSEVLEYFPVSEETILVGHSCGAGFLVRWLSEHRVRVGKVALVAPWIDPQHTFAPDMFNDLKIDAGLVERTKRIHLFYSTDDEPDEIQSAKILQETIKNIQISTFSNRGHFTLDDMGTVEFVELRDWLLS